MKKIPCVCLDCGNQTEVEVDDEVSTEKLDCVCDSVKECNDRRVAQGKSRKSPHRIFVFQPDALKGVQFYCHRCDSAIVDSDKPETGKFYNTFGHARSGNKLPLRSQDLLDFKQVIWALCPPCQDD